MRDAQEQEPDHTRPPAARQLLPILLIAPAVTAAVWWTDHTPPVEFWPTLAIASAAAGVLGFPVLYWALDHGRTGALWLGALGGAASAVFPLVLLASGVAGQALLGGRRYLEFVLKHGAPIPGVGQISWSHFAVQVVTVALVGAASGVIYAVLRPYGGRPIATRLLLALGTLVGALALAAFLH